MRVPLGLDQDFRLRHELVVAFLGHLADHGGHLPSPPAAGSGGGTAPATRPGPRYGFSVHPPGDRTPALTGNDRTEPEAVNWAVRSSVYSTLRRTLRSAGTRPSRGTSPSSTPRYCDDPPRPPTPSRRPGRLATPRHHARHRHGAESAAHAATAWPDTPPSSTPPSARPPAPTESHTPDNTAETAARPTRTHPQARPAQRSISGDQTQVHRTECRPTH